MFNNGIKRYTAIVAVVVAVLVMSGCNDTVPPSSQNNSTSSSMITDDNPQITSQSNSEAPLLDNNNQTVLSEDEYSAVLDKWIGLGGTVAFKNIGDLDTKTAVAIYSSFVMNHGRIPSGMQDDWLAVEDFDSFIQYYFDIDPEIFHQKYLPNDDGGFNPDKGFWFDQHTTVLPTDTVHEMLDYGLNEDGTHFFQFKTTIELPEELFAEGANIFIRTTTVTFKYINGEAYFSKAEYQQDGGKL